MSTKASTSSVPCWTVRRIRSLLTPCFARASTSRAPTGSVHPEAVLARITASGVESICSDLFEHCPRRSQLLPALIDYLLRLSTRFTGSRLPAGTRDPATCLPRPACERQSPQRRFRLWRHGWVTLQYPARTFYLIARLRTIASSKNLLFSTSSDLRSGQETSLTSRVLERSSELGCEFL